MEATQHAHRFRHRLRRKQSSAEDAFTQASDFAVFVDFFQPPRLQARNFQTNGIRSDVDGGKGGHRGSDLMLTIEMSTISILTTGRCCASAAGLGAANPLLALSL